MKMVSKVLLTAAAIAALAAPAMATDKLIVKDSTGANPVFSVDDAGAGIKVSDTAGVGKSVIDGRGYLGVGTTSPLAAVHGKGNTSQQTQLMMTRQDTNNTGGAGFIAYHNNITNASCTAAATPSACCTGAGTGTCPTVVTPINNDRLGYFLFGGYKTNGTTPANAAGMSSRSEGVWTDSFNPAYFAFETTGTASTTRYERFRISANGNIITGNLGGAAAADMAVSVTDGFLYIPNVAGALTSCATATVVAGHSPVWYDTTNNKICTCRASAMKCTASLL